MNAEKVLSALTRAVGARRPQPEPTVPSYDPRTRSAPREDAATPAPPGAGNVLEIIDPEPAGGWPHAAIHRAIRADGRAANSPEWQAFDAAVKAGRTNYEAACTAWQNSFHAANVRYLPERAQIDHAQYTRTQAAEVGRTGDVAAEDVFTLQGFREDYAQRRAAAKEGMRAAGLLAASVGIPVLATFIELSRKIFADRLAAEKAEHSKYGVGVRPSNILRGIKDCIRLNTARLAMLKEIRPHSANTPKPQSILDGILDLN